MADELTGGDLQDRYDVAILGGGLAGLTLALQLKRTRPETSVMVAEKREGPAPEAAFKVGESSLEIGAHYFARVLGLEDHIDKDQLPKMGVRFWFPAGDNSDIAQAARSTGRRSGRRLRPTSSTVAGSRTSSPRATSTRASRASADARSRTSTSPTATATTW